MACQQGNDSILDMCSNCRHLLITDHQRGEKICTNPKCGIVSESNLAAAEPKDFVAYRDENGKSTTHHAPGLGTNAAKAASSQLQRITKGHVLKSSENKYVTYALSCIDNFIKFHYKFGSLYEILRIAIKKTVNTYVTAKKMAKEGIEEIKVTRMINGKKVNSIRYYSIDRIMEKTILAFCAKNKSFADNLKAEAFCFHKIARHSTRGNKGGTIRENGYKEQNPTLDVLACIQHGPFSEKSHNAHFKAADHVINGKQVTFPTYQKYFVLGFAYYDGILKNSVKQNYVQRERILRENSRLCKKCRHELEDVVKTSYRDTKEQKHKKYTSVVRYHVIRINGRKVLIKDCLDDIVNDVTSSNTSLKSPISF